MKDENPKLWWKEVKRLSGSQSNSGNVINHIHIEELEDCNNQELANIINQAFLEPLEEYRLEQPLTKFPALLTRQSWGIRAEDNEAAGYTESIKGVWPGWNT